MIFDKVRELFGGSRKNARPAAGAYEPTFREEASPALKRLLERTSAQSIERGLHVENTLRKHFGADYRLGINLKEHKIVVAKANSQKPEIEFPVFITGTELVTPEDFSFIWPWAHEMLGLPPFPVWTEYANELQSMGGGGEGIEEFMTPMLKYHTEQDLNTFYMAIQGWGNLDAFYRLAYGTSKIVVFLTPGAFELT